MVDDVDTLYEEFNERGVEFVWTPENQEYGNRDMKLLDNNGYPLLFATDLENNSQSNSLRSRLHSADEKLNLRFLATQAL